MDLNILSAAPPCPTRPCGSRIYRWEHAGFGWVLAGRSVVAPLAGVADADVLQRMDPSKRRMVRRASRFFAIRRASWADAEAWAAIPTEMRGHGDLAEWFSGRGFLLVAVTEAGAVAAGSGFLACPGGWLDYRANASTCEARGLGANVLLAYEGMRLGRERGCLAVNWNGQTAFKRQMGGEVVNVYERSPALGSLWRRCRGAVARRGRELVRRELEAIHVGPWHRSPRRAR